MGPVFRNALMAEQCPERAGWSQAGFEGQTLALHLCWAFQEGLGAWAPGRASGPRSSTLPAWPSVGDSALLMRLLLRLQQWALQPCQARALCTAQMCVRASGAGLC